MHFVELGALGIEPFDPKLLNLASYTFTLGNTIRIPRGDQGVEIDYMSDCDTVQLADEGFILPPGAFVLAETREHVSLRNQFVCLISTRGGAARVGLNVTQGSFFAEPDTDNSFILEISNGGRVPLRLVAGQRIAKGVFLECNGLSPQKYPGI